MIVTSKCHDAPVRKLDGKYFCQTCGQQCELIEQQELPIDSVPKD